MRLRTIYSMRWWRKGFILARVKDQRVFSVVGMVLSLFSSRGRVWLFIYNPGCTIYKKISLSINKGKFDLEKRLHMSQYRSLSSVAQRSPESELSSQEFCFPWPKPLPEDEFSQSQKVLCKTARGEEESTALPGCDVHNPQQWPACRDIPKGAARPAISVVTTTL